MKKLKAAISLPILATTALAAALLALGIGFLAPTGEQSKLEYSSDLWCVSNYLEKEPQEILKDGRPRQDPLLDSREDWIVRDQVKADTKEQAEAKARANGHGLFEPSNKDELRAKITANDKAFFTTHFNTGATMAGPCWGTGWSAAQTGRWLNDAIRENCFGIKPVSDTAGNLTSTVLTSGSCKTKSVAVKRIKGSTIDTPSSGTAVVEQHLVTKEENFHPSSTRDRIDNHYSITEKAIGVKYSHKQGWTSAEDGGSIGGGSGSPPPAAVEPYVANMYWANRPAEGTRMILTNPANGKSVVVAAGYETGPGDLTYVIGAQEEAMQAIGAVTGTKLEFGFAEDQNLPFGPINCSEKTSRATLDNFLATNLTGSILGFFTNILSADKALAATKTIAIDPGHGSAVNRRDYEGPTELAIGQKLKAVLEQKGYKVVMTHNSIGEAIGGVSSGGENQDNIARAQIVNNAGADLTIRLHSDDNSDDRFAVIYPDTQAKDASGHFGPSDTSIFAKSRTLAEDIKNTLSSAGFSGTIKTEKDYLGNGRKILILSTYTKSPVVTLELYGHESAALRQKYASADVQAKVAQALASAVDTYEGGSSASTTTGQPATTNAQSPSLLPNADPNCPKTAPPAGPSEGQDYRAQIAAEFEKQYSISTNTNSTDGYSIPANLPQANSSIAKVALSQVGYQGNGDCTKYDGCAQWCAYFATWVYRQAGYPIPSIGSSREVLSWFKSHGHSVFQDPSQAGEGDIVVWARGENTGHIGIVVANNPSAQTMQIVEGNTSNDQVKLYSYSYDAVIHKQNGLIGFGRW
jgi:N-acetylmuramoyl-L-alanine amidase